jgi:hypothetical protein
MSEATVHTMVLVSMGISGMLWFAAALRAQEPWPPARRLAIAAASFILFVAQCVAAFPTVAEASAALLFGFLGCFLGSVGAVLQLAKAQSDTKRWTPARDA